MKIDLTYTKEYIEEGKQALRDYLKYPDDPIWNVDDNPLLNAVYQINRSLNWDCLGQDPEGIQNINNPEEVIYKILSPTLPCIKQSFVATDCDQCPMKFSCLTSARPWRDWVKEQIHKAITYKNQFDNECSITPFSPDEITTRKKYLSNALHIEVK